MFKIVIIIVSLLAPNEPQVLTSAPSYTQTECEAKLAEVQPKIDAIAADSDTRILAKCFEVPGRDS